MIVAAAGNGLCKCFWSCCTTTMLLFAVCRDRCATRSWMKFKALSGKLQIQREQQQHRAVAVAASMHKKSPSLVINHHSMAIISDTMPSTNHISLTRGTWLMTLNTWFMYESCQIQLEIVQQLYDHLFAYLLLGWCPARLVGYCWLALLLCLFPVAVC